MTVTLEIDPEIEKGLQALAREHGMSLSEYLQEIAVREAGSLPLKTGKTGEQRAKAFLEWAESFPDTAPLPDDAISRASMHPDRL